MVSLPPGSKLGRYQVLERIGRGGMASVFRAYDPDLDRHVAAKILPSFQSEDPTFVPRFRQEAQAVAKLSHPNIIQVHDFGEDKGFTFIVMEYITGGTLANQLTTPMPVKEVLRWAAPLARALEYAHSQGIIHRDIKPANVLVDSGGNPKLSDFGLARLLEGSAGLTGRDVVLGTPEYMAPEQALGRPADQKSDIYSFGVIVYRMLVGQVPFHGDTPTETLMSHIHQPVPLPTAADPKFDARVEAILIRALSKEPDDRYATASELVEAIESAVVAYDAGSALEAEATAVERVVGSPTGARLLGKKQYLGVALLLAVIGILVATMTMVGPLAVNDSAEDGDTRPSEPGVAADAGPTERPTGPGSLKTAPDSSIPDSVLSAIFQRVHAIRDLEPLAAVVPNFVSPAALRDQLLEAERQQQEAVEREQSLAQMLGLIPAELDLVQLGLDTVTEAFGLGGGRAASYDRTTQQLYIRDDLALVTSFDELGIFDEFEIVVGYTMALLQQHFDVAALSLRAKSDADRLAAFEALVIGDANTVGQEYMAAHISADRFAVAPPPPQAPTAENSPEFVKKRAEVTSIGV